MTEKRKSPALRFRGYTDDWEQRKLGDVVQITMGQSPDGSTYSDEPSDYILVQGNADLQNGWVCPRIWTTQITKKADAGDLIMSVRAPAGAMGKTAYNAVIGRGVAAIKGNEFIYQLLVKMDTDGFWKTLSCGSTFESLNSDNIKNAEVKIPTTAEQIKIGGFFQYLDNLITLHQKKCFEWKKSGFSSASISWEQRKLGDQMYIKARIGWQALTKNEYMESGDYYLVTGTDIDESSHTVDLLRCHYVTKERYDADNKIQLKEGDIIVTKDGTIGKVAMITGLDKPATLNSHLFVLRDLSEKLDNYYLLTILTSPIFEKFVVGTKTGSTLTGLPQKTMVTFEFTAPNIQEQQKIAGYFRNLDHLITLHQRKLELLERLRNSLANRCFIGEKCTMSKLILYHGSPNRVIVPKFGFGEDRHDYGRGFYLTENLELAKEWAVCRPDETNGWVHKYELEMEGLNILDFQKYDVLSWLAELMKHRDAADSRRYKMLAQKFIEKYGIDTCGYDVITGWRANASYFYIAKEFVRDNIDIEILEELLSLGGLGIQFCIKSERAFAQLSEVEQDIMSVDYSEFNDRYNSGTTICRAARS